MGAKWHWCRFKSAVMRRSIKFHEIAKLKSDPGLFILRQAALKTNNIQEKLSTISYLENYSELERDVHEVKLVEDQICIILTHL